MNPVRWLSSLALLAFSLSLNAADTAHATGRRLYVAVPGVRDLLEYGGHGVLVFDMDHGHQFVKRIPAAGLGTNGHPMNVKGVCVSVPLKRLFISTLKTMEAIDLVTEKVLWEKSYEGGCDRMAISPDGMVIYLPSLESDHWHVVDARTGDVITKVVPKSGSHNTVYGRDGKHAYLAGLKSPWLVVTDTATHTEWKRVGPFSAAIRPFTVDGRQHYCYVNVNERLGFEVGDIRTGAVVAQVTVAGYSKGPVKRHGCPSHGMGLTPNEKELWVTDAFNQRLHIFDNTVMPPKQKGEIKLKDEPGWVTFSLDGKYGYPSTGEVIEVKSKKILTNLKDEEGRLVQSEKLLEIDFKDGLPVKAGDQFGLGRVEK